MSDPLTDKLRRFGFVAVPRYRVLTRDEIAAAREWRTLGIAWWRCARLLRVNQTSLRVAVLRGAGATIGSEPSTETPGAGSSILGGAGEALRGIPGHLVPPPLGCKVLPMIPDDTYGPGCAPLGGAGRGGG